MKRSNNHNRLRQLSLLLAISGCLCTGAHAMNSNLASQWGDGCSPPQTPFLSFTSPQTVDLMFIDGDTIELYCQAGLRSMDLTWSLHRNMLKKPFRTGVAEALPGNRFIIRLDTAELHPGFYDVRVELDTSRENKERGRLEKRPVTGICTFGWKVDDMEFAETRPDDFSEFWDKAIERLGSIPLDPNVGETMVFGPEEINTYNLESAALPADYDPAGHRAETVESFKVDIAGPDGGRIYGWVAKPLGDGPFPVMLVLPGAGFSARSRPLEHARHGYLAMDIQVHGQDVDLESYPKIPGYYNEQKYEPVSANYYYNVHLRCVQALNYLLSRPEADTDRVAVVGGSQGGRLGIVLAGLDSRVKAVVSTIANSPNHPHLRWVARCNGYAELVDKRPDPNMARSDGMDRTGAPPVINDAYGRCIAYYDPMNYAPDIHCSVLMQGGLIDPVSPPISPWAVFHRLGTEDKTIVPIPGHGHDWSAAFDRDAWRWLDRVFANPRMGVDDNVPDLPDDQ